MSMAAPQGTTHSLQTSARNRIRFARCDLSRHMAMNQ